MSYLSTLGKRVYRRARRELGLLVDEVTWQRKAAAAGWVPPDLYNITKELADAHQRKWLEKCAALARAEDKNEAMKKDLIECYQLIEKLDEAMASPERVARDTKEVGGFVSTMHICETAEDIVARAVKQLKNEEALKARLREYHSDVDGQDLHFDPKYGDEGVTGIVAWVKDYKAELKKTQDGIFDSGMRCVSEGGQVFYLDPEELEKLVDRVAKLENQQRMAQVTERRKR